jgi:type IV secretory pathway TrbL component
MTRLARVVVPGLPHHVTRRGNGRGRVFFSDAGYRLYRDLPAESCKAAGAAVGTAAGLAAAGVAGAATASAGARLGLSGGSRAISSAASLAGAAQAGFRAGGFGGAFKATIGQPAADLASRATRSMRDSYRAGAAHGFDAAAASGGPRASPPQSSGRSSTMREPDWARRIRRRGRIARAGAVASQSIREGDRGASGEGPDLDPDK